VADDAGVVRLNEDTALIHTLDFFSPVVDDPVTFGRIAAANALSDVYAMGGTPLSAMNIVCFPAGSEIPILREILRGGLEKIREAGALLVGGHSVDDPEIKYGLSITGTVHPDRILMNSGARPGDRIVLSKPLGTGILATALKRGKATDGMVAAMTDSMSRLNRRAGEACAAHDAHGATDITGFGLVGHAREMAKASGVALRIHAASIPFLEGAPEAAKAGIVPGGTKRNAEHFSCHVDGGAALPRPLLDLLHDAQTSGGILASLPADRAEGCAEAMRSSGDAAAAVIGEVLDGPAGRIILD
jgi:selenide,water dikinase